MSKYKSYAERLRDPRWQKRRLEIMQRDEFCCTRCFDSEETLNVHHHYYTKGKDPWDYPDEALTTLCEDCHTDVEDIRLEILKSITWEIPLDAVHRLAINVNPWALSDLATALTGCHGDEMNGNRNIQIKYIDKAINALQQMKKDLKKGKK